MTAEEAIREICDLLDLYPVSTPQQVVDKVLFMRSDCDELEFVNIQLRAEITEYKRVKAARDIRIAMANGTVGQLPKPINK